jgi:hypothetical protein
MSPFEATLELGEGNSLKSYTILFGQKDESGNIVRYRYTESAPKRDQLLNGRPQIPEDWWFVLDNPPK